MNKRAWTQGPWYNNHFRVVEASVPMDHPMRWFPDCNGEQGDGPDQCCDGCDDGGAFCRMEWDQISGVATIARLPNLPNGSRGDQVVSHPEIHANRELITLAPEMAEAILAFDALDVRWQDWEELEDLSALAEKLRAIASDQPDTMA